MVLKATGSPNRHCYTSELLGADRVTGVLPPFFLLPLEHLITLVLSPNLILDCLHRGDLISSLGPCGVSTPFFPIAGKDLLLSIPGSGSIC